MHEQLVAHPDIVSPLQILLLRLIAKAEREYGFVGLRLEGGTALSAYYLRHREVGEALARGIDPPMVSAFPLRLIRQVSDAEVRHTIRLAVKVCADMAAEQIGEGSDGW